MILSKNRLLRPNRIISCGPPGSLVKCSFHIPVQCSYYSTVAFLLDFFLQVLFLLVRRKNIISAHMKLLNNWSVTVSTRYVINTSYMFVVMRTVLSTKITHIWVKTND